MSAEEHSSTGFIRQKDGNVSHERHNVPPISIQNPDILAGTQDPSAGTEDQQVSTLSNQVSLPATSRRAAHFKGTSVQSDTQYIPPVEGSTSQESDPIRNDTIRPPHLVPTKQPANRPSSAPSNDKSNNTVQPLERVLPSRHSLPSLRGRVQALIMCVFNAKISCLGSEQLPSLKYQQQSQRNLHHYQRSSNFCGQQLASRSKQVTAIFSSCDFQVSAPIYSKRSQRKLPDKVPSFGSQHLILGGASYSYHWPPNFWSCETFNRDGASSLTDSVYDAASYCSITRDNTRAGYNNQIIRVHNNQDQSIYLIFY